MSPADESSRDPFTIRRGVPHDLVGLARVHVETWKTTYRGIVPDDRLDALSIEGDLAAGFGSSLTAPPSGVACFVAMIPGDEIVGYAFGGPTHVPEEGFNGELRAIYILKAHQGRGIGTALVREVARHLLASGRTNMIVWVLAENPSQRFYEKLGARPVGRRTAESRVAGGPVPEVSYGWQDLRPLARE
jgi:ribosomal protein S18 acetylase RimI-like enzyme